MTKSGIYQIHNLLNGKSYIGSSYEAKRRLRDHAYLLSKNIHSNRHLQAAYNLHGKDFFEFIVVEFVEDRKLLEIIEQKWIDRIKSSNPEFGYNIRKIAKNNFGLKASVETKARLSAIHKGKPKSEEHKEKLRKPKATTENMKGRKLSQDHLAKLIASNKGRIVSEEMKAHLSAINTGKIMTEQAKKKLSVVNKGKIIPPEQRSLMIANRKLYYLNLKLQKNAD